MYLEEHYFYLQVLLNRATTDTVTGNSLDTRTASTNASANAPNNPQQQPQQVPYHTRIILFNARRLFGENSKT